VTLILWLSLERDPLSLITDTLARPMDKIHRRRETIQVFTSTLKEFFDAFALAILYVMPIDVKMGAR
jgi:hypothetical protein